MLIDEPKESVLVIALRIGFQESYVMFDSRWSEVKTMSQASKLIKALMSTEYFKKVSKS